jgi:hypothetical protein
MVVQIPLTLSNWEALEQLGWTVKGLTYFDEFKEFTHISVLTNSRKFTMTHRKDAFPLTNINFVYAINLLRDLITNRQEVELLRQFREV